MSTWTLKEVKALNPKNGGGNENCKKLWLAKGDVEKYRPHPGDDLDKYKRFIEMAYVMKKFYAGDDEAEEETDEPEEEEPEVEEEEYLEIRYCSSLGSPRRRLWRRSSRRSSRRSLRRKRRSLKRRRKKSISNPLLFISRKPKKKVVKKVVKKVAKKDKEVVKSDNLLGFEVDSAETRIRMSSLFLFDGPREIAR